jgi:hypothetical protein
MSSDKFTEKLSTPASGGHSQESPTADWVRTATMISAMNRQAEVESKRQLPEDFSASDFNVIRARTLSSQI